MSDMLQELTRQLLPYMKRHDEVGDRLFDACKALYKPDLLVYAALCRSLCLLCGFNDLINSQNFVAAVPLVRLQLDNCLRIAALAWVRDPHVFAAAILEGKPLNTMYARDGKKLTDAYLCRRLSDKCPWLTGIYEELSGFIHLSDKHVISAIWHDPHRPGQVSFLMAGRNPKVPYDDYDAIMGLIIRITDLFFELVDAWSSMRSVARGSAA